jgi:hypothetical protein
MAATTDLFLALLHRHGLLIVDTRSLPVCVTVQTEAGARHFFGPDVAGALARAFDATSPRKTEDAA